MGPGGGGIPPGCCLMGEPVLAKRTLAGPGLRMGKGMLETGRDGKPVARFRDDCSGMA